MREQQEEILRDTDELNSRVQNNRNQSELSETQQRLEQAHEEVRRASQALEKGLVSQALTSGSRAQRELDELREEFRRRTSDRFADQARELTRQAQELAEAEQQVAEILNQKSEEQEQSLRSLRENSPREQVLEELQRQDERLEDLLQNMQTAVKESEQPQPLLAEQLYDSFRRARQDRLPENLQEARQSLQRGLVEDARQLERSAREGIERLRDDVQQAAESVLGDENEALQRARDELDTLAQQVDREIREADTAGDARQVTPDGDGIPQIPGTNRVMPIVPAPARPTKAIARNRVMPRSPTRRVGYAAARSGKRSPWRGRAVANRTGKARSPATGSGNGRTGCAMWRR